MNIEALIVTDLGHFKCFRLHPAEGPRPSIELLEESRFPETHGPYSEHVSDQAGRNRDANSAGLKQPGPASAAQETHRDEEVERRLIKLIAEKIESRLGQSKDRWLLIAPRQNCQRIVDQLGPSADRLAGVVGKDLTRAPEADLITVALDNQNHTS